MTCCITGRTATRAPRPLPEPHVGADIGDTKLTKLKELTGLALVFQWILLPNGRQVTVNFAEGALLSLLNVVQPRC